jgi:TPR repeat protein
MTHYTRHVFTLIIAFILTIPTAALGQNSYDRLIIEINTFNEAAKRTPGCERTQFVLPKNNTKDRMGLLEITGQLASTYQSGRCCDVDLDKALSLYTLAIEFGNEDKVINPATSDIVVLKINASIAPKIAEIKGIKEKKRVQAELANKQARENEELAKQKRAKYDSDQAKVVAYAKQLDMILKDISEALSKGDGSVPKTV